VDNRYKYRLLESIQIKDKMVDISEQIKYTSTTEVYKVISNLENREEYILKIIYGESEEAINTISLYLNDKNDYFVKTIALKKENNKTFLLLKYYKDNSIFEYIKNNILTEQQRDKLIMKILKIGCFLHQQNYLHADIKPNNFFIEQDDIRLGDLDSLRKLDNLQMDNIDAICGTKGFKYTNTNIYTLKDEIFAYIATIYYIEEGSPLMSSNEFLELSKEDDTFYTFNTHARERINYLSRETIRNYLLDILDSLEMEYSYKKLDCCSLLENFKSIEEREEKEIEKRKKRIKREKIWKKAILITLGGVALISISIFLFKRTNIPTCQEAFFVDEQIIRVNEKTGNSFYTYTKDKKFVPLLEERQEEFIDKKNHLKNSKGEVIECLDGRVHITF